MRPVFQRGPTQVHVTPNQRFFKEDLIRIRDQGPSLDDIILVSEKTPDDKFKAKKAEKTETVRYIPSATVVPKDNIAEPHWGSLHQASLDEFYLGLQARNWQHPTFNPHLPPWHLQIYKCSGRALREPFTGYRIVVKE